MASMAVAHQGQFPAVTFTFNLPPNVPLGVAVTAIQNVERKMSLPTTIHPGFQGTAQAFQDSLSTEPSPTSLPGDRLYRGGILYENYIHPVTILSTLPSVGVGALLALLVLHSELSIIAFIRIIVLIALSRKTPL